MKLIITLKIYFGEEIAELSYALANEKGRNRKERANDKYYEGIKNTPFATYIKVCDRLANVTYSKSINYNYKKLDMYRKEYPEFKEKLYTKEYNEMFLKLETLLKI